MSIVKTLQPPFIRGYTTGFCDGLRGKENSLELPEEEWTGNEILDIEKKRSNMTFITDVDEYREEYTHRYKKIGYNWGHLHGTRQRKSLQGATPEEFFENRMQMLALALEKDFLHLGRKGFRCYRSALDPDAEQRVHVAFTERFVMDQGQEKREQIRQLLKDKKIQRAIDQLVMYTGHLKDLEMYLDAISLADQLQKIRALKSNKEIAGEDYKDVLQGLGEAVIKILD